VSAIWIIAIIAGVCVLFTGLLYIFQSHFVYYPGRNIAAAPDSIGLHFEKVSFETTDGVRLYGWFIPYKNARAVVLFCHGNGGNMSHRLDSIELFHRLGLDIFIFDYRGYGQSEGKPSERGTYRDVKAAWQYLVEEWKVHPDRIIVFGRSLGGAIACWLAGSQTPGALILESTFTSIPSVTAKRYPYLPIKRLVRFKYNTAEYLSHVNCPVLVIHSRDDEMIPYKCGEQLFEIAKEPKKFLEITGSHNEGFINSGRTYEEGLDMFISEYF
jgi:fermentation-respiration switch protein FrsA (DUF1100 family)